MQPPAGTEAYDLFIAIASLRGLLNRNRKIATSVPKQKAARLGHYIPSTAKPRRKKEVPDQSPAAHTPNSPTTAHLAPKGSTNYKFFGNRYLDTAPLFQKPLSAGRNCV